MSGSNVSIKLGHEPPPEIRGEGGGLENFEGVYFPGGELF